MISYCNYTVNPLLSTKNFNDRPKPVLGKILKGIELEKPKQNVPKPCSRGYEALTRNRFRRASLWNEYKT